MPSLSSRLRPTEIHRNKGLFAAAVVFGGVAGSIALPSVIIPWAWILLGAPVAFIGLSIPLLQAGRILGPILALRPLTGMRRHKWLVVGAEALWGVLFVALMVVAGSAPQPALGAVLLLLVAFMIGVARGAARFGYREVIARALPGEGRGKTLARAISISGGVAFLLALGLHRLGAAGAVEGTDTWHIVLGAIFALLAALAFALLYEEPTVASDVRSTRAMFGRGVEMFRTNVPARRFMVLRLLLLSLDLAFPFYAAHMAAVHGATGASLSLIIVFSSLANILQRPIWGKLLDRSAGRSIIRAAFIAASGGMLLVGIELSGLRHHPLIHGAAFLLTGIAVGGALQARNMVLVQVSSEEERPILSAASTSFAGIVGLLLAGLLGAIAHFNDIIPAVAAIVLLQVGAGLYGRWMIADAGAAEPVPSGSD